jgi:hypothetical protein
MQAGRIALLRVAGPVDVVTTPALGEVLQLGLLVGKTVAFRAAQTEDITSRSLFTPTIPGTWVATSVAASRAPTVSCRPVR